MITDLISGQVHMLVINLTGQARDLHQAGKLRMLAVTTPAPVRIARTYQPPWKSACPA